MNKTINYLILCGFLLSSGTFAQDGLSLFKQNCGVCHTVGKGKIVGPDLKDSHSKYKEDWFIKWVKSSQTLVKKNDPVAVKIFNENNKMVMPDQNISEADIKNIYAFIKSESEKKEEVAASDAPAKTPAADAAATGEEKKERADEYRRTPPASVSWQAATYTLGGFCLLLVIVIVAMGQVIKNMVRAMDADKGEQPDAVTPAKKEKLETA